MQSNFAVVSINKRVVLINRKLRASKDDGHIFHTTDPIGLKF